MATNVTDKYSNVNDNLVHAAKVLRSKHRRKIFKEIYRGQKRKKTQEELQKATRLPRIRVLQEAGKLFDHEMIGREKVDGLYEFSKMRFYAQHKDAVLRVADYKKKLVKLPT